MKRNRCDELTEEIGVYLDSGTELGAKAAEHLRNCRSCEEKLAELKAVAALQDDVAANLPVPRRRMHRRKLERALKEERKELKWMPAALAGVAAMVTLVAVMKFGEKGNVPKETARAEIEAPTPNISVEVAPTILSMQQDFQNGREFLAVAPNRVVLKHYRVRDVKNELRN